MKLYIIRHAEAVDVDSLPDEARHLTSAGRTFFRRSCDSFMKKGMTPHLILTSPLVRAVQTAEILAERAGFEGDIAAVPELAGMLAKEELARLLARWPEARKVVLVGHEPYLGRLVRELLGTEEAFSFQKGAGIALGYSAERSPSATFRWYIAGKKKIADLEELTAGARAGQKKGKDTAPLYA